jgi:uncharacterized protein YecE (DUF72 family)
MVAPILIGTANWADHKDFYPEELDRGSRQREKLTYYAGFFPFVEVDTTFYGIPTPQVAEGWAERTPDTFRFNVKAYRSLTRHERDAGKQPRVATPEEERDFLAALVPLRCAGKLVAVHYQFPPWFTNTPAHRDVLDEARQRHPDDIVAIEFRHRSWFDNDALHHTEELLRELDATLVGVDAPQVGDGTAPPVLSVTSERLCIARFHGRNRRTWYIRDARTSADRFDYLYHPEELAQWVPAIQEASRRGIPVHVVMNNNRGNDAVTNAFDMAGLLGVPLPPPPRPIRERIRARDGALPDWAAQDEGGPGPASPGTAQLRLGVD